MAMGGNFLSATPDTDYTASSLRRCGLTAQVSTKLNRSHLVTGREALILPCLGRSERDVQASGPQRVSVEDSMSVVHASIGRRPPPSADLKSEVAIVCGLGRALWGDSARLPWSSFEGDYRLIREAIEACVPGFERFEERLEAGFVLPNVARERDWRVVGGRARFTHQELPRRSLAPEDLLMMTVRSHDQYNTTIYGWDDRYRGIYGGRRVVMMSPEDMAARGLCAGQEVRLVSLFEGERREVEGFRVVEQSIPRGCVATYFPEANALVPARQVARGSHTPASKSVVVRVVGG